MFIYEGQVQLGVTKLASLADKNTFKLNRDKSISVVFSRKPGIHPDPDITLNGVSIPVKNEDKFLGLFFNNKLTFVHARSILSKNA